MSSPTLSVSSLGQPLGSPEPHPYPLETVPVGGRPGLKGRGFLVAIGQHWKIGAVVGAAVALPAFVILCWQTPQFRSEAALRVVVETEQIGTSAASFVKNHELGLLTRSFQEYFYDRLDPGDREEFLRDRRWPSASSAADPEREHFLARLNGGALGVSEVRDSHVIRVSLKSPDRELSARLANQYVACYADYLTYRDREKARTDYQFLKRREPNFRDQAHRSRQELGKFRLENGDAERAESAEGEELRRLNAQREAVQREYATAESILLQAEMSRSSGGSLHFVAGIQEEQDALRSAQRNYAEQLSSLGEKHPQVKEAAERVRSCETILQTAIEQALRKMEDTRASAGKELEALDLALEKIISRVVQDDSKSEELSRLTARAESDQKSYDEIVDRLNQLKIAMEIPQTSAVLVEDKAVPSAKAVEPRLGLSMLLSGLLFVSIFLAVPFGLGCILGQNPVRFPLIHRHLPADLGQLPAISANGSMKLLAETFAPGTARDELFRIAQQLERSIASDAHGCLLVTSAQEREGKSFIAAALSGVFCAQGRRTLLVDCNLGSPSMTLWFPQTPPLPGLLEWLQSRADVNHVPECQRHGSGDLYLVASRGWARDPVALLSDPRFAGWLRRAREEFDLVILDGPEVNGVGDAAVLANLVDGVVIVSDRRISSWKQVSHACRALQNAGGKVVGMIGNRR